MDNGWIKIHRKLLEWEWYEDINTKVLFIHLLLTVNFEDKKWRGITIKRGQLVTSLQHLADETQLSVRQVRVALDKLIMTKEVTKFPTPRYTLVQVNNYCDYQVNDKVNDKLVTNKRQANDKLMTTTKEYKEIKKERMDIDHFEKFWASYPRKVGKKKAQEKFMSLPVSYLDKIFRALDEQKRSEQWQTTKYIPHPITWLNQARWEDEPEPMSEEFYINEMKKLEFISFQHRYGDDLAKKYFKYSRHAE